MSLSIHRPHDIVSFLYLFFSFFFLTCLLLLFGKERRSVREEKLGVCFKKIKKIDFTRLDYYVLFFCACFSP